MAEALLRAFADWPSRRRQIRLFPVRQRDCQSCSFPSELLRTFPSPRAVTRGSHQRKSRARSLRGCVGIEWIGYNGNVPPPIVSACLGVTMVACRGFCVHFVLPVGGSVNR